MTTVSAFPTGAMDWMQRLTWKGLDRYNNAPRMAFLSPSTEQTETYLKAYDNFRVYWMLRAGHAVSIITHTLPYSFLHVRLGHSQQNYR